MSNVNFPCAECGGSVVAATGPGRVQLYRAGVFLPVPESLAIPTCERCGETYIGGDLTEELNAALEAAYPNWVRRHVRFLVETLEHRHDASQKRIASICDVTPSHLNHVVRGKAMGSVTLIRLLEAFVACPTEFERHLEGRAFERDAAIAALRDARVASPEGFLEKSEATWVSAGGLGDPSAANDIAA